MYVLKVSKYFQSCPLELKYNLYVSYNFKIMDQPFINFLFVLVYTASIINMLNIYNKNKLKMGTGDK